MHKQIPRPTPNPQRRRASERNQHAPAHVPAIPALAAEPRPRADANGDVHGRRVRRGEAHLGRPAHRHGRVAGQGLAADERPEGGGAGEDGGDGEAEAEREQRARERGEAGQRRRRRGGEDGLQRGDGGQVGEEREDVGGCEEGEGEVGEGRVNWEAWAWGWLARCGCGG